ncbi:MAG: maleylpyruvate isomerase N-terminal domain-containing protein [Candidatus Rokuibacteriota bacterium]
MTVDRTYIEENGAQRDRLKALVGRLSDAELSRPMPAGWTVAAVLGHLAFWDQRIAVVVGRWRKAGAAAVPPAVDGGSVDWVNDAGKPMLLAVPPRRAAEIAVAAAEAADGAVASLPDDFVAANQKAGGPVIVLRARHRREHLDEIEQTLRR